MRQIQYSETRLVSRHRGTLPVLLTCPHDGVQIPTAVHNRTETGSPIECPPPEFDRDLRTRAVTTGIAQRLLDLTGEAPSVVIAEYDREYIDANRSAKCAFEPSDEQPPEAQQYYDEYHNTIREFIDDIRAENGGLGLLFDIHGTEGIQGNFAHLYLGTVNGCTVKRLMRADPQALQRRRSLRGFLEAAGYDVVAEAPQLIGGHTVRAYGSHNPCLKKRRRLKAFCRSLLQQQRCNLRRFVSVPATDTHSRVFTDRIQLARVKSSQGRVLEKINNVFVHFVILRSCVFGFPVSGSAIFPLRLACAVGREKRLLYLSTLTSPSISPPL